MHPPIQSLFRFRLATLILLAPSIAITAALWAGYGRPTIDHSTFAYLTVGLIGLLSALLVLNLSDSRKTFRASSVMMAALAGGVVGLMVQFYVIYLLSRSGALPALVMNEDRWGSSQVPGVVVRIGAGILVGIVCTFVRPALRRQGRRCRAD